MNLCEVLKALLADQPQVVLNCLSLASSEEIKRPHREKLRNQARLAIAENAMQMWASEDRLGAVKLYSTVYDNLGPEDRAKFPALNPHVTALRTAAREPICL